ncbi:MAG: energy transducer TonB [Gammaproteobacteria bacterium]|nr:energy transducer TonB [Gammaproteobacteria bacterium]
MPPRVVPYRCAARWAAILLGGCALLAGCSSPSRPPQFLSGPDLVYPPAARAAGIEGHVVVRYDVTAEGAGANPVVVESEPAGTFDAAALASLSRWRFRPRIARGEAVSAPNRVSTLRFRLGESDEYAGY